MLKLIKLDETYKNQLFDLLDEWLSVEKDIVPYSIIRNDYKDFDNYLQNLEVKEGTEKLVPDSTFFCLDTEKNVFVAAVNIRHYLNDVLLLQGGHIGYGVHPSYRKQGIATKMLELALVECKSLCKDTDKVLVVADKDNIGSVKCIENNGGILENEVIVDDETLRRYFISI